MVDAESRATLVKLEADVLALASIPNLKALVGRHEDDIEEVYEASDEA